MSEYEMDWACGWYDQFRQALHDGDLTVPDLKDLYKRKQITEFQYNFGMDYLTEKG